MANSLNLSITRKQGDFINTVADEVLFGGAAGGGKSYGQLVDALLYALKYEGSKQIIFRRTFPELDKSIIRTALGLYPREVFQYNSSSHTGKFKNGSIIDFGYCDTENDVYKYQSAEFDVIRFDELTHFTESMYIYMMSRLRGANSFPKSIKSSTNPGGIGHQWVKDRFIDIGPANTVHKTTNGTRIFMPAKVQDNRFLLDSDPNYVKRLENLSDKDKKALLYGDWDIFEGQYFNEFKRDIHVIKPFEIPKDWRIYIALDYGLDMLAVLWIAVDSMRNVYVYRELPISDTIISNAARMIKDMTGDEKPYITYAPPDLWGRSQESGKSRVDLFREAGLNLVKSNNNRESGWMAIKEMLKLNKEKNPQIHIFETCPELIRCLGLLQYDKRKPNDCATNPHDITHLPDALRYFAVQWISPAKEKDERIELDKMKDRMLKCTKRRKSYF